MIQRYQAFLELHNSFIPESLDGTCQRTTELLNNGEQKTHFDVKGKSLIRWMLENLVYNIFYIHISYPIIVLFQGPNKHRCSQGC